jgi:proteic killer suppression protein
VKVTAAKLFIKQLKAVPEPIRLKARAWIAAVESVGLREVSRSPGFHDEPLKGDRKGQRSVRLNRAYRLIYRVIREEVHIEVLEVNKHDF